MVVDHKSDELIRSTKNLQNVKLVQASYVNVFDTMNAHHIVITKKALDAVHDWLGPSASLASSKGTK
jgi:ribosomal protein L4